MFTPVATDKISHSLQVHIALMDDFIALTEVRMAAQDDDFARDSLGDLLGQLRLQRASMLEMTLPPSLWDAA